MTDEAEYELQFAEAIGRFFESGGISRMAGRVWAALLITEAPYASAAQLQEALGASSGSISSATRALLRLGLIERVAVRGQRRDYFAVRRGAGARLLRTRLERLVDVELVISDALEHFDDRTRARDRLDEIHEVYHWYAREFLELHERFRSEQDRRAEGSRQS